MPAKNNLEAIRRRAGLSQEILGVKAGTTGATIRGIERRGVDTRISTALAIARVLGASVEEIWGQAS